MKGLLTILTGFALLSQASHVFAQAGVTKTVKLEQLFSYHIRESIRSSANEAGATPTTSPALKPSPARKAEGEEHRLLLKVSCEKIMKKGLRMTWLNSHNGKMKLQLRGIYTQGAALYFLLRLNNRSPLDYDVENVGFFIVDRSGRKKPSLVISQLQPMYCYDSSTLVRGYSRATNVIVFPQFTLPAGKRLLIEVREKNGGRRLQLQANNLILEKARII